MKRKVKDRLIEMAFEGSANLPSGGEFTSEAQAELKELQRIKEGLIDLRSVPECQLSIETLRDSILRAEMRAPQRSLSRFAWLAPAAAGLLIVGLFAVNRLSAGAENAGTVVIASAPAPMASNSSFDLEGFLPNTIVSSVEAASSGSAPFAVKPSVRPSTASLMRGTVHHRVGSSSARAQNQPRFEGVAAKAVEAGTSVAPAVTKSHPTIVIINPDVNGDTGAKTANEVETGSNVVIGG